ncbi:hypothetical protein SJ05684_c02940 [Sinorhizobium sojae CCBAU 05684]|uniref:Uncharacterized protein n=1 Tax=Sinorhizobium sojae CCBAU 05684 TaxID=716928 RepID=A0A249P7Q8_9HYPH|nr:hypothetical protein SJ05684_c02940 [Sinorhizobium sojae CCBAU 05684]
MLLGRTSVAVNPELLPLTSAWNQGAVQTGRRAFKLRRPNRAHQGAQ